LSPNDPLNKKNSIRKTTLANNPVECAPDPCLGIHLLAVCEREYEIKNIDHQGKTISRIHGKLLSQFGNLSRRGIPNSLTQIPQHSKCKPYPNYG